MRSSSCTADCMPHALPTRPRTHYWAAASAAGAAPANAILCSCSANPDICCSGCMLYSEALAAASVHCWTVATRPCAAAVAQRWGRGNSCLLLLLLSKGTLRTGGAGRTGLLLLVVVLPPPPLLLFLPVSLLPLLLPAVSKLPLGCGLLPSAGRPLRLLAPPGCCPAGIGSCLLLLLLLLLPATSLPLPLLLPLLLLAPSAAPAPPAAPSSSEGCTTPVRPWPPPTCCWHSQAWVACSCC